MRGDAIDHSVDQFIQQCALRFGSITKRTIVEVGVFSGESTDRFAGRFGHVIAVDLWDRLPIIEGVISATREELREAEHCFDRRMIDRNNVTKVKASSVMAAKLLRGASIDVVYIDAAHDLRSVRRDFVAWLKTINRPGVFGGHDVRKSPVKRCIKRFLGEPDFVCTDRSWGKFLT